MPPRLSKRQKTQASEASEIDHTDDKHAVFTRWALEQGVQIKSVKAASLPGRGIGLITTRKIKAGEQIVYVPGKAMIIPDESTLSEDDFGLDPEHLSPQAQLAAYLTQLKTSPSSVYAACSAVWPVDADFRSSLLWYPPDSLEKLSGKKQTDNESIMDILPFTLEKPLKRALRDYERDAAALCSTFPDELHDSARYHWVIANTRSFHWKPPGRSKGVMAMCPFLDYMNHCPSGEGCTVTMTKDGYELCADRNYNPGEEILATYGAHTNDKLIVHYGFMLPNEAGKASDDGMLLDDAILPLFNDQQKEILSNVGYLGNYVYSPATDEFCFRTQVAVRSIFLTANEWEYFMASGEDVADDKTKDVRKRLSEPLIAANRHYQKQHSKAVARMKNSTEPPVKAKLKLVVDRWEQILHSIDTATSKERKK